MNKLIKRLIESLFDDIDDIVDNDATQSVFTQKVIDDELNKLKNMYQYIQNVFLYYIQHIRSY